MAESVIEQLTVMVITHNEAPNLARCLDAVRWAPRILIIDSGSSDQTPDIVRRYPQAEILHRPFDDFASQCNFGLSQVKSPWVLSMDADYVLTPALQAEIQQLKPDICTGWEAAFTYCIHGRALRGTLYPPRTVLYRRDLARYRNQGHGHRVELEGKVGRLTGRILHDDRKPLARWFNSQQRYAVREAEYLLSADPSTLRRTDRIRRIAWPAPLLVFFYTLVIKRCVLDGWPGWFYALQRTLAEILIALSVIDKRLAFRSVERVGNDNH